MALSLCSLFLLTQHLTALLITSIVSSSSSSSSTPLQRSPFCSCLTGMHMKNQRTTTTSVVGRLAMAAPGIQHAYHSICPPLLRFPFRPCLVCFHFCSHKDFTFVSRSCKERCDAWCPWVQTCHATSSGAVQPVAAQHTWTW